MWQKTVNYILAFTISIVINVMGLYLSLKWDWIVPMNHSLPFLKYLMINSLLLIFGATFYRFLFKMYSLSKSRTNKLLQFVLLFQTLLIGMTLGAVGYLLTGNYALLVLITYYVITGAVTYDIVIFHFGEGSKKDILSLNSVN
ncbi:hypothetical protein [Heyndrickxia ginsengihumi]|uniref:hypothetical protein n=1 Tax=Heyndrickxia ginsengihumi TaxID=363870 RepID=UPI00203A7255|nr:hypothetical protein [Heyndrickxia ginsengihumi]MCM3025116.1 hypothetical protein [Heyndrickxia ginsengihumi]